MSDQCFRKDPRNVLRFPLPEWPGGVPPASILAKYRKPHPRKPDWYLSRKTPTRQTRVVLISRVKHSALSSAASAPVSDHAAGLEGISCNNVTNLW
jgi:hypothetical protein